MILMQGKGVSAGVVSGPLYFFRRSQSEVIKYIVEDMEAERARFSRAQEQSVSQLAALAEKCRAESGDDAAMLFETHAMFVEDEDYVDNVLATMEAEHCNAEYAVQQAGEQFAAMFAAMDDAYMQAREADIRDVTRRILNNLAGSVEGGIDSEDTGVPAAEGGIDSENPGVSVAESGSDSGNSGASAVEFGSDSENPGASAAEFGSDSGNPGVSAVEVGSDTGKPGIPSAEGGIDFENPGSPAVDGGIDSEVPVILAADDLAPSETLQLDKSKILGFITQKGSGNSHTAILARTLGIPAICGLGDALKASYEGRTAYIDGESGKVCLEPDTITLQSFQSKQRGQQQQKELMETMKGQEDVTLDGRKIRLYCNIGSPEDVTAVLTNDARGIGLFRSEFLYLAASDYPSEEEQFEAYKSVAAAMKEQPVIIRTLDIGADKQVDYFHLQKEENPAMGVRAIRISLNRPEVFRTQLRAIYRASAYGRVAIMFPMITSVWEVKECRRACKSVMLELSKEGIPYNPETEIGIMIETPASVFMAPELAKQVDFFSVGTNDLTQYTLACDRQCNDLGKFYDPHHPAVLRALKMAADAAHEAGIWIGICGELAADISMLPTFLAIGIDELSVSPAAVLPLRAAIRKSTAGECTLKMLED